MTLAEALSEGLKVTGVGVIIVFSVLIILMLVMMAMKAIFYKPNKEDKKEKDSVPEVTQVPNVAVAENGIDEGTLLAVLTAAVAASMNTSTYRLNIKSYKRVEKTSPAWNRAGVRDIIDSRF